MEQNYSTLVTVLLALIVLAALFVPFLVHKVEEELEIFLLACGVAATTISSAWSWHLIAEALKEPVIITAAVLVLGLLFKKFAHQTGAVLHAVEKRTGPKWLVFLLIAGIGLVSSFITAIVAALVVSEVIKALELDNKSKIQLTVYACFAIGFGAILTPVGEPLSTIVISKLKDAPHFAGFFFLLNLMGVWVIPAVILFGLLGMRLAKGQLTKPNAETTSDETYKSVTVRAGKVYLFITALIFLGEGLKPLAEQTITKMSDSVLYWVNTLSAVLDNATLASIEMMPSLSQSSILFLMMSLIIAGGLLIPGNIPNIICASKLNIKSKDWAKAALPVGGVLMVVYFAIMIVVL